ncbi:hypothetical protein RI367_000018 [Sorochytrium milnesiophthora]
MKRPDATPTREAEGTQGRTGNPQEPKETAPTLKKSKERALRYRQERDTARDQLAVLDQTFQEVIQEKDGRIGQLEEQLETLSQAAQQQKAEQSMKVTLGKNEKVIEDKKTTPATASATSISSNPQAHANSTTQRSRLDIAAKIKSFAAIAAAGHKTPSASPSPYPPLNKDDHPKDVLQLLAPTSTLAAASRRAQNEARAAEIEVVAIRGLDARRIAAMLSERQRRQPKPSTTNTSVTVGRRSTGPFVTKGGIRDVLRFISVPTQLVVDIETVGRSVIELYVARSHVDEVRQALAVIAGAQTYSIITQYDPTLPGKMTSDEALQHYLDRLVRIQWTGRPIMREYARHQSSKYQRKLQQHKQQQQPHQQEQPAQTSNV